MGKRQRTNTSEDADGTCKGKRLSSEHGRPSSAITSPLLAVSESSQSDNEVDIVWGHSPPPLNLNLHSTPGPKTRRKSDYTNKDIADMIECIHSRNSSQQSPTISTPPLLGLWMQGRQDVEMTPVGAKGQRLSRKLPSRKPSNEAWASLAKDLHMLAEASKDFPLSQKPAEFESEDIVACQIDENLHKNGVPECQIDLSVTPKQCPPNQGDAAREDSAMTELWGDDSWFEADSIVRIATQLEEQEASKKLKEAHIDPHRTAGGNSIPQTMGCSGRNFETHEDKNASKGFKQAIKNTNASSSGHSNHQFTSPPNCRRLSTKQIFQTSSECNLKKENPIKGRASFRLTASKENSGLKMEDRPQFSKQHTYLKEANSSKLDKGGNTQTKEALSVITRGKSQFAKGAKHDSTRTSTHPETPSVSLATNFKKVDVLSTGFANSHKIFEAIEEVSPDCDESMDLFESSLLDEEVERKAQFQEDSRKKEGQLNFQNAGKVVVPSDKVNKLESDISSDLSFIDEELLAAVEKEEMHWEEINSQQVDEVVKTSKSSCKDEGLGNKHSFAIPYRIKNAVSTAAGSALNQTAAPITSVRVQSSQFSFKSSQKDSQKGMKQVMEEQTGPKNTDNAVSSQQKRSPVSGIVSQNNRMNQSAGKCVNQFSAATSNKVGKQFERTNGTQFSTSHTVQFQPKKSTAKVENGLTIQEEKSVPTSSNDRVTMPVSNFSPFKAPVSSQFVKSSNPKFLKDNVSRSGNTPSLAPPENDIVSVIEMKKQSVKLTKSSNDSISFAKKDNPATTGTPTSHPVGSSVREKLPETVSSSNGNNAVPSLSGSSLHLGEKLSERKSYGQTKSVHLSQFSSGSKDTRSEKTSNSIVTHSRMSLRNESKSDTSSISRNPGLKASSQFQTKPSHSNTHSVNQATSSCDLNSSSFSHVSSQFSSSSQVKCTNDTSSQVTPSPIFTTNTVRPPVISKNGTIPQPPEMGTSLSVFNGHSTDYPRSLSRKPKDKGTFSAGTLNSRNVHHNQFSQFSKAKKEHSVFVDPSEGETFLTSGDVLKEEGSICTFQSTKERQKESVLENHSTLSGASNMSNDQNIPSQFVKAGNTPSQSSPRAVTTKSVLTTVTNVYANDGKQSVVPGYAKQFSKVSRTSSVPSNGKLVPFQKEMTVGTEPRKDCDFKSSQKGGAKVNFNTSTVKTPQGKSTESQAVVKPQNQLCQPRTGTVTIIPSQDKRPCSQEQIEQKRRVALARKKQREILIGNHSMNLRERTVVKK